MDESGVDRKISLFLEGAKRLEKRQFRGVGLAALLVAAVPPALVAAAGGMPGLGSFILAVLFGWPAYRLFKRLSKGRRRRLHVRLAEEFQTLISDTDAHYEFALRRLILTNGREPLVEAMAEHLPGAQKIMAETGGGTVRFESKTQFKSKSPASQSAQTPSDLMAQLMAKKGMAGMPSFASKEEVLDYVKTHPGVKATYTESKTDSGGTFTTVRIVKTSFGPPPAGAAPVEAPPMAKPTVETPTQETPTQETPTQETPTQEPEYIPLDPYNPAGAAEKG